MCKFFSWFEYLFKMDLVIVYGSYVLTGIKVDPTSTMDKLTTQ